MILMKKYNVCNINVIILILMIMCNNINNVKICNNVIIIMKIL